MYRRKFIKNGLLFVTGAAAFGIITPRKSKPQAFTFADQAWLGSLKKPSSGGSGGFTPVAAANLLGWYRFEEDTGTSTADSSGHNGNGILLNGASWAAGVANSPVSAYGIYCDNPNGGNYTNNQSVDTNSSWADNLSNFSVCSWFKIPTAYTTGDNATIIGKMSNGASNTGNGWEMNCELNVSPLAALVFFCQQSAGNTWVGGKSTVGVNDGNWHHGCATVANALTNSPTIVLYLDGSTAHTVNYTNSTWSGSTGFSNTNHVLLGNAVTTSPVNSNEPLYGTMADQRVYNIALSASQVSQIYGLTG